MGGAVPDSASAAGLCFRCYGPAQCPTLGPTLAPPCVARLTLGPTLCPTLSYASLPSCESLNFWTLPTSFPWVGALVSVLLPPKSSRHPPKPPLPHLSHPSTPPKPPPLHLSFSHSTLIQNCLQTTDLAALAAATLTRVIMCNPCDLCESNARAT